ncbi:unnamed protein product [Lepeophtheirus salmonis]|uniref:(salmon louse) hypothetical protein n=1 Tax=Lepeophtheirus salmonis TaxID=72036 RepID=A0A7R8CFD1_LEPSM|nr:unnamed protein product [Lepeophtheirus salmonis]CAF2759542.1 unnamed protein product [Lepeophtheirus salmonis]
MANCISRELEDVLYKAFLSGLLDRKVARQTRFDLEKHPEMTAVEASGSWSKGPTYSNEGGKFSSKERPGKRDKAYYGEPMEVDVFVATTLPQQRAEQQGRCVLHPDMGHSTKDCRVIQSAIRKERGEYGKTNDRRKERKCFKCGKPGHYRKEYPTNSSKNTYGGQNPPQRKVKAKAINAELGNQPVYIWCRMGGARFQSLVDTGNRGVDLMDERTWSSVGSGYELVEALYTVQAAGENKLEVIGQPPIALELVDPNNNYQEAHKLLVEYVGESKVNLKPREEENTRLEIDSMFGNKVQEKQLLKEECTQTSGRSTTTVLPEPLYRFIQSKVRPMNPGIKEAFKKQLEQWEEERIVAPTISDWGSAIVPVVNPDKT